VTPAGASPYDLGEIAEHARVAQAGLGSLEGKVALVVGAGDLGAAAALGLAVAGATVAVANRSPDRAAAVAAAIADLGRPSLALAVDVTDAASVDTMFEELVARFGGIDVLVLAFGVNHRAPAAQVPPEAWAEVIGTNLSGVFHCCRAAHPLLRARGGGRVIVVASAAGHAAREWPPTAPYGASKAGALHLVRFLAVEWARDSITVNAVSPGYFRTRLTAPLLDDEALLERLLSLTPMARLGSLEEFIAPVVFLASDVSSFITGQALVVDGGRVVV
jgi:NAD(P)-dependent dehydrogenase (short-subunit alcohol dehydrogenase family)